MKFVVVNCAVCLARDAETGVLCEACTEALDTSSPISPEQIEVRGAHATPAALVDVWGQPYHLDPSMAVGRSIGESKIIVLDGSISRRHAELEQSSYWSLRDLGSTHGTFVNETRIDRPTALRHGDRLRFGDIAMFFAESAPVLDRRFDVPTYRLPARKPAAHGVEIALSLHVPSGGGAAFAVIDGRRITLTTPQYELLDVLARRMRDDAGKPDDMRGFVAISELLRLSLDVPDPGEQHVRQLVYRVRRTLINAGIGDLIDVRRGVGYRLRGVPV